ncbi:putative mitochondrial import inner membrane translocase subunit [Babesia divergens]|uniref:Mitochondrial import inner membrane translocase subunit n=1 Tax=Babesia divergens TaxID=32595 RepID=A0AAD9LHA5_BABDI|nr:putative mitochondrial import inner membrane translocase subunit [Babesia divergens]
MSQGPTLGPEFGHLTSTQRAKVMEQLTELQYRDTLETYNGMVEHCFSECITSFRSKDLDKKESRCIDTCVKLFMDFSQRIGLRFAEKQQRN